MPASSEPHNGTKGNRAGAWPSLDFAAAREQLARMANPLDREIEAALRKGRQPESWKRPGAKRGNVTDQKDVTGQGPTGESGKPPSGTGMNRPGHPPR